MLPFDRAIAVHGSPFNALRDNLFEVAEYLPNIFEINHSVKCNTNEAEIRVYACRSFTTLSYRYIDRKTFVDV